MNPLVFRESLGPFFPVHQEGDSQRGAGEGRRTGVGALLKSVKIIFCFFFQIAIGPAAVSLIAAILRRGNLHLANQPK